MISSQRFWVRLPQRGIVILFITLALLPGTLPACLPKNQRRITHSLGSSTQHVDVLWVKQETFTKVTSDDNPIKLKPLHHYGKFLSAEGLPLYEAAGLVRTIERGDALARALGNGPAV